MARNLNQYEQLQDQGLLGEEIITGEGVALELPAATAASRLVAGGLDWLLYMAALIGTMFLIAHYSEAFSEATLQASFTAASALWIWLVPALVSGVTRGSSLGKLATRTRVVRSDGGVITMRHAFIRATVGIFEVYVLEGIPAFIAVLVSKRAQRMGDMLADTYVVRWPKARSYDLDIQMPSSMVTWANYARTREMPGGLMLNIANHFKASATLTPQARDQEARALAAAAERYVSPAPPWGTPPEDFLAAMLVIRHDVEVVRGEASRERHDRALASVNKLPFTTQ